MKTLTAKVDWSDKNFGAVIENVCGIVVVTNKTMEGLKEDLWNAVKHHLESLDENEKEEWMNNQYSIRYKYTLNARLHLLLSATSRSTL